jgi:hypothetical protein
VELRSHLICWAQPYHWFCWDWLGPLLIAMGLAGPTRINIPWDWLALAALLVPLGLGGPATIDCNWIGFSWNN